MRLTCYIIDDESHSIEVLERYILQIPWLELLGKATNPVMAVDEISRSKTPDLILLDVDMPQLNGLDVADLIGPASSIIFTTSFREYAPEAFDKNAVDYLLKPVNYQRFLKAVAKVRTQMAQLQQANDSDQSCLFVKSHIKGQFRRVTINDIRYIENIGNYIYIHTDKEKITTYLTLNEILSKLPQSSFSRIHQSYVVNHACIHSIDPGQVRLSAHLTLPIGGTFRAAFREKILQDTLISKRERHGE